MNGDKALYLDTDILPEYLTCDLRRFAPDEKHVSRTAGYDVLIIMLSGTLHFYEDGKLVSLKCGQWYLQRAGLAQEGREPSLQPVYYYFHFRGAYRRDEELGIPLRGTLEVQELQPLMERLYQTERSSQATRLGCNALFYTLLTRLYEQRVQSSSQYQLVRRIESYILDNYTESITADHLSRIFKYSGDYILRLFRRYLETTPHQYLTKLRVDQVSRLLLSTDKTLCEIAEMTGYQEVSTLYRTFIQQKGVSPREWKKKNQIH